METLEEKYRKLRGLDIYCEIIASSESGCIEIDLEEYQIHKDNGLYLFDLYDKKGQLIK